MGFSFVHRSVGGVEFEYVYAYSCVCSTEFSSSKQTKKQSNKKNLLYLKQCNRMCITAFRTFSLCEAERGIKVAGGWVRG